MSANSSCQARHFAYQLYDARAADDPAKRVGQSGCCEANGLEFLVLDELHEALRRHPLAVWWV
jgi:hypothetical protein